MAPPDTDDPVLAHLNAQQLEAVAHSSAPLLIVAGAGSGKTRTLVHRVAYQIQHGVPPNRILLLTFTRRAAGEMLRRVDALMRQINGEGQGTSRSGPTEWFNPSALQIVPRASGAPGARPTEACR